MSITQMSFRNFLESKESNFYHQTSVQAAKNIMKRGFSLKNAAQGIIWFTNDLEKLHRNEIGAAGNGAIIQVAVDIKNPAGWEEYDKLMLDQISAKYDGVLLPSGDGTIDGFVFNPSQINPIKILTLR